jgi:hypothetical protein
MLPARHRRLRRNSSTGSGERGPLPPGGSSGGRPPRGRAGPPPAGGRRTRAPSRRSDHGCRPVGLPWRPRARRSKPAKGLDETRQGSAGPWARAPDAGLDAREAPEAVRAARGARGAVRASRGAPRAVRAVRLARGAVLGGRGVPGGAPCAGWARLLEPVPVPPPVGRAPPRAPAWARAPAGAMLPGAAGGIAAGRGRRAAIPRCGLRSAGAGRRPSGCRSCRPLRAGRPRPRARPRAQTARTGGGTRCRSRPPFGH